MPRKPNLRDRIDTRVTVSLSPLAYKRLRRLVDLMESQPATEARLGLEEWIFSDDFARKLANAEEEHSIQQDRVADSSID